MSDSIPAKKKEIISFFNHLERALDASGFLRPKEKKSTMMINLRNIFSRTDLFPETFNTVHIQCSFMTISMHSNNMDIL